MAEIDFQLCLVVFGKIADKEFKNKVRTNALEIKFQLVCYVTAKDATDPFSMPLNTVADLNQ